MATGTGVHGGDELESGREFGLARLAAGFFARAEVEAAGVRLLPKP